MKQFKNPFADPNLSYKGKTAAERGDELLKERKKKELEAKIAEKRGNNVQEQNTEQPQTTSNDIIGIYDLIKADTYAAGVKQLRESYANGECPDHPTINGKVRPLRFAENLRARIEDYNRLTNPDGNKRTEQERKMLFTDTWLDSCAGVAYKVKSTKFKIIPECNALIDIPNGFNNAFLTVDYSKIQGIELDSNNGEYGKSLTKQQVLSHPAWNAVVENDKALLSEYFDITANLTQRQELMGFYVLQNTNKDQLRALYVSILDLNSDAFGNVVLLSNSRLLRVAHK